VEFLVILVVVFIGIAFSASKAKQREAAKTDRDRPTVQQSRSSQSGSGSGRRYKSYRWIPPGQKVVVAGCEIKDGMVYVGSGMASMSGYDYEASLIDPDLKVRDAVEGRGVEDLGYWPNYSQITPGARGRYLRWLEAGRRDPGIPIGYVFLFYYGLERRILFDSGTDEIARAEVDRLLEELRQLLGVYKGSQSFVGYASSLITYVESAHHGAPKNCLSDLENDGTSDVPFAVKVEIGRKVANGEPIPAELALVWVKTHPEIWLRTAGKRCPGEFDELFKLRYQEETGSGLVLKRNKTNLRYEYRSAGSGSPNPPAIEMAEVPDVTRLKGPTTRLSGIAERVQNELEAFSRWVGKTEDSTSAAAIGLLPPMLMKQRLVGPARELANWVEQQVTNPVGTVIATAPLLSRWPATKEGKLSKKDAEGLGEFLGALGIGIEPDVRAGGANPSRCAKIVLFRMVDGGKVVRSTNLESAAMLLQLGVAIAAADGTLSPEEEKRMEEHLAQSMGLSLPESQRLWARMRLFVDSPPSLTGLKQAFEHLPENDRRRVGQFAISVAAADGRVDPSEIKVLTRIYKALGFEADAIHGELHSLATGQDAGPTTVFPSESGSGGYKIPASPSVTHGVTLDVDRIAKIRSETQEVASLLRTIFEGEQPDEVIEPEPEIEEIARPTVNGVAGLDEVHAQLVRELGGKPSLSRSEFDSLARKYELLPSGAIEIINEAAFGVCDEPLRIGFIRHLSPARFWSFCRSLLDYSTNSPWASRLRWLKATRLPGRRADNG